MDYKRPDGSVGTYSAREAMLLKQMLRRGTTSAGLMSQAKAVERWIDLKIDAPVPLEAIRTELEYVIGDPLGTYLGQQAASKALKCLEWIDGEEIQEWPSETPNQPVGVDDYWPYRDCDFMAGDPFADLATSFNFGPTNGGVRAVTHRDRDAARTKLEGPPPWIRGRVPEPDDRHDDDRHDDDE